MFRENGRLFDDTAGLGHHIYSGTGQPSRQTLDIDSNAAMTLPQSSSAGSGYNTVGQHDHEEHNQTWRRRRGGRSVTSSQLMTPPRERDHSFSWKGEPAWTEQGVAGPLRHPKGKGKEKSLEPLTPGQTDDEQFVDDDKADWISDDGESGGVPLTCYADEDTSMEDYVPPHESSAQDLRAQIWTPSCPPQPDPSKGLSLSSVPTGSSLTLQGSPAFSAGPPPALGPAPTATTTLAAPINNSPSLSDFLSAIPDPLLVANPGYYNHQPHIPSPQVSPPPILQMDQPLADLDPFGNDFFQLGQATTSVVAHGDNSQEALQISGPSTAQLAQWVQASMSADLFQVNSAVNFSNGDEDDSLIIEDYQCDDSFSKFLHRWTMMRELHPDTYGDLDLLDPVALRSVVKPRRARTTVNDLQGSYSDLQGLNWTKLGTTRARARKARARLYQNRTNVPGAQQSASALHLPSTERYFAFRESSSEHRVALPHFQLRNLLSAASRSDVYYVGKSKIMHTDPSSSAVRCVLDLSNRLEFRRPFSGSGSNITCLAASDRVIIAGGFEGEYALADASSPLSSEYTIGHVTHADNGITNHVQTYLGRTNGVVQAAFSSNDSHLRVLDCYTDDFVADFEYGDPINCSAMSPDGRMRVLVQDSTDVLITDAERGIVLRTLQRHNDYAFACAWADDGIHVATGAQDMQTVIYDARWWNSPLKIIASDLSCPRSLHFSPVGSGRRVLVAAEQADAVNIIDAVTFEKKQTLEFFGGIAGCGFVPDGSELFVANCDRLVGGILEFERIGWGERYGRNAFEGSGRVDDYDYDWDRDDELEWKMEVLGTGRGRRMRGLRLDDVVV